MPDFYSIIALLMAGLSLALGSIGLFVGFKKREKTYQIFGIMAMCMVVFLLIPPVGFILSQEPPYPAVLLVKRLFIFINYGMFPWFVISYTGYKRIHVPPILSSWVVITYCFMFIATPTGSTPVWSLMALAGFVAIFIFGMLGGLHQLREGDRSKAKWFLVAMVIFGALILFTVINLFMKSSVLFFPLHSSCIPFLFIMGLRFVKDILEKQKLEKLILRGDTRWQTLMKHAHVFVMELDRKGNIKFINDFGVKLLGYHSNGQILYRNWFDTYLSSSEAQVSRRFFEEMFNEKKSPASIKNTIQNKHGKEIIITWSSFLALSETGEITGVMNVGRDVSAEENAFQIISQLKSELHK